MMINRGNLSLPLLVIALLFVIFIYQNNEISVALVGIRQQLALNGETRRQDTNVKVVTRVEEKSLKKPEQVPQEKPDVPSYALERVATANGAKTLNKDDIDSLRLKLYLMTWPSLTGYDNRFVTPERNGIDAQLFDRISIHQKIYPQPLLRIKKGNVPEKRHEWQFEKIIHQTWVDEQIPGRTVEWVKKWLQKHPDWTYMFWSDKAARQFISEHYPALLTAYESFNIPVQKADMFRYVVLYAFGGVYADLDMEPLRNLNELRNWSSCILSREPDLQTYIMSNFMNCWGNNWTFTCNAFMACQSHHPFMHYVISRVVHWSPYIVKRPCSLGQTIGCTGPWMLSFAHAFYRRSVPEKLRKKRKEIDVICPAAEYFLPTFDETRLKLVETNCASVNLDKKQKEICDAYHKRGSKNEPFDYSYTTHHWFHSYHYNVNTDKVDVRTITKVLQWSHDTQDTDFELSYI